MSPDLSVCIVSNKVGVSCSVTGTVLEAMGGRDATSSETDTTSGVRSVNSIKLHGARDGQLPLALLGAMSLGEIGRAEMIFLLPDHPKP